MSVYTSRSLFQVVRPTTPSAVSPKYRWKASTARLVAAPNWPSTVGLFRAA